MTTIALVLMGALTANASNLRLKHQNSSATSMEISAAEVNLNLGREVGLHEAGEEYYSSSTMACQACYQHGVEGSGLSNIEKVMGRKCVCLAYKGTIKYKMYCAAQAQTPAGAIIVDKTNVSDGIFYRQTDATNVVAASSGCKCNRTLTSTGAEAKTICKTKVPVATLPRRRRTNYGTGLGGVAVNNFR